MVTVTVFGLGFVGLTTALGFAELGHKVYGVEINEERVDTLKSGRIPFLEPGLNEALTRHLGRNFILISDIENAINNSECIYYCVGTPYGLEGEADLTYLFSAIESTLNVISDNKYRVLVTKSTIPPSTSSTKIVPFVENHGKIIGVDIGIANNPEFLREGHCWDDFMNPDRIVLGISDEKSEHILRKLYSEMHVPVHCVSLNTAEFIKYLSNTLLATLISYSNEMALIAESIGDIDVSNAFRILVEDKRWNHCGMTSYVYPGCGYGGYCLPKDTCALYSIAKTKGFDAKILNNVIKLNERMPEIICNRIQTVTKNQGTIGILGLSFKPFSDDVRDTPAAKIIQQLICSGHSDIYVYDPVARNEFKKCYPDLDIVYCSSLDEIVKLSNVLVIVTAWDEFKRVPEICSKTIVDCRYML